MLTDVSPSKSNEQLEIEKQAVAKAALRFVHTNMLLGLGTGSTASYFLSVLGEAVRSRALKIEAIATSLQTAARARDLGIAIFEPRRGPRPDLTIDGADQITPDLSLIKGAGGALLREKIVAHASLRFLVIADSSKRVARLGCRPVPVEVTPFATPWVMDDIERLQGKPVLRMDASKPDRPFLTDQQNHLLDCDFGLIADPKSLAVALDAIPGVAGHGLFLGLAHAALIADDNKLLLLRPNKAAIPLMEDDVTLD
jgi:ribose 5-phosphate isomerase A